MTKLYSCELCGAEHSSEFSRTCPDCDEGRLSGDLELDEEPEPKIWCVAVYLVDRAYGGPEEGGWYYDCGELVLDRTLPLPRFFTDKMEAYAYRDEVQAQLDADINVGRRPISSVLSEGMYQAIMEPGLPPHHWPETRPHYE